MSNAKWYQEVFFQNPSTTLVSALTVRQGKDLLIYERHWHDEFELALFTEGEALARYNDSECLMKPGYIMIRNSGDLHELTSKSELIKYIGVLTKPSFLGFDFRSVEFTPFITKDDILAKAISDVNALLEKKEPGFDLKIKSQMCQIIVHLLEHYTIRHLSPADYERKIQKSEKINKVITYINKNYQKEITIETLAKLIDVSPPWLCHLFKNEIKKTPIEYLNFVRLTMAKKLCTFPNARISQIAKEVGIPNLQYFSRIFKKQFHLSPKQYIQYVKDHRVDPPLSQTYL